MSAPAETPHWMSHYLNALGAYLQSLEQSPSAMPPPIPAEAEQVPPGVFGALHKSILARDFASVIKHLKAGENPLLRSPNGMNAFDLACALGNLQVVKLLGGEAAIARVHETGWVSLMGRQEISLADIPLAYRTPKVCITALIASKNAFEAVPPEYQTLENLIDWALQHNSMIKGLPVSIRHAPEFYQRLIPPVSLGYWPNPVSGELLDHALSKDKYLFSQISEEARTYQRCLAEVSERGYNLRHVPMQHRDEAMCHAALNIGRGLSLHDVPVPLRTYALCLRVIKYSGELDAVPEQHRDEQMFSTLLASLDQFREVARRAEILEEEEQSCQSPLRRLSPLLIKKRNRSGLTPEALAALPESLRSYDICLDAVIKDCSALAYVPREMRTVELCASALGENEHHPYFLADLMALIPPDIVDEVRRSAPNMIIHHDHCPDED